MDAAILNRLDRTGDLDQLAGSGVWIGMGSGFSEFDAASDEEANAMIADICMSRASISSLPPDTEIIITLPDGSSRTTTLEFSKRLR